MSLVLSKKKIWHYVPVILMFIGLIVSTNIKSNPIISPYELGKEPFDFDKGNAGYEVVVPVVTPILLEHVSTYAGDASLILRSVVVMMNAWYDATAPYHATAVGVYSHLGRRPVSESETNKNINIALIYSSYRLFNKMFPEYKQKWRDMLIGAGLEPDDDSTDLSSPIGLGNLAGNAVAEGRENDGMNQVGNMSNRQFNPRPFMDYTGYKPVNTAYELRDPSKWQPDIQKKGFGLYKIQQFVTPQYALVEPYSYNDPRKFSVPAPDMSDYNNLDEYKKQADEVLQASAALTDLQKLKAQFFDHKILAFGSSLQVVTYAQKLSLLEFIQLQFLTNMATFDSGIFIWQEKRKYDAVRPFSAIRHLYGNDKVTAWAGVGKGTMEIPANQWASYLPVADHPEYPSATACFCAAHVQSAKRFLGNNSLGLSYIVPAKSARIETGLSPAEDTLIEFATWSDFNKDCGQSRLWAGVHFQASIDASMEACPAFGDTAYVYMKSLIAGTAKLRVPSKGRHFEK